MRSSKPGRSTLLHPVIDGIEPHQSEDNEIDRDDDVQQSRQYQNQNTGDERDKRRDMGGGNDHGLASWAVKGFESGNRRGLKSTKRQRASRRLVLCDKRRRCQTVTMSL